MFDIIHSPSTKNYLDEQFSNLKIYTEELTKEINNSVLATFPLKRKVDWTIYTEYLTDDNEQFIKDYVVNIFDVYNLQIRLEYIYNIFIYSENFYTLEKILEITHKEITQYVKNLNSTGNGFNTFNILTKIEMVDNVLLKRLKQIIFMQKFDVKEVDVLYNKNKLIHRTTFSVQYDESLGTYKFLKIEGSLNNIKELVRADNISHLKNEYTMEELAIHEVYLEFQRHFVLCKENGIDEFIIKNDNYIFRNIVKAVSSDIINCEITDITEIKRAEEFNRSLAYYDSLTGIANRGYFLQRLSEILEESEKGKNLGGLLFIDVDDFKLFNDTYGHKAGDAVLVHIAKQLEKSVRGGDLVARYAGDEFTVICRDIREKHDLETVVQRIMENISKEPLIFADNQISISLSVGIAIFPEHGTDREVIINCADVAMYKAKNTGKNRHRYYDLTMKVEELNKEEIRNGLKNAIARNELYLEYMLQYDSFQNKFFGIESLMRWNHPTKGIISPLEFIGIAEDSGMIIEMGYWALEESLKHLKQLDKDGYSDLVLGVNFTDSQFRQMDLVEQVCALLDKYEIAPNRLMIEISERTSTWKVESTARILNQLREVGVQVCLDDFGTGLSSIIYLHEFSISTIKVDKSFIKDINDNDLNFKITSSLLRISDNSEICIIAEGVENKTQYETLKSMGCHLHQGYYISRPLTFEKLHNHLIKSN